MVEQRDPRLVHIAELFFEYEDRRDYAWTKYFGDERSAGYLRYQKLIHNLFISGKPLSKMEAAALFATSEASAIKHLDTAQKRGWIRYSPDRSDRRKVNVIATFALVQLTEAYLTELVALQENVKIKIQELEAPLS